jgi:hypothetical protein
MGGNGSGRMVFLIQKKSAFRIFLPGLIAQWVRPTVSGPGKKMMTACLPVSAQGICPGPGVWI